MKKESSPPPRDTPLAKKARIDNKSVEDSEKIDVEEVEETKDVEQENDKSDIKSKFLVAMPDDFHQFWDFCCMLNSTHPHCKQPMHLDYNNLFITL